MKEWTFLFYLCGDNHLEKDIASDFDEICRTGSTSDIYVVVQHDRPDGARRYLLPEKPNPGKLVPDPSLDKVRVNTGEPAEAADFFCWGIEQAPSKHVAIIFSGLGISPAYIRESFAPKTTERDSRQEAEARAQQHLFSICHDETSRDALSVHELRHILERAQKALTGAKNSSEAGGESYPRVDLVGLDAGASAFVEIAYQLEGLADVFVASQRLMPDAGWPYQKIITGWQRQVAQHRGDAQAVGRLIVDEVANTYKGLDVRITAVNLGALEETGRVLDTLSLSLMQSLGDWHVLMAIQRAVSATSWISLELPEDDAKAGKASGTSDSQELLPAVDLLELLGLLHEELKAECKEAPPEHGQRKRIEQLSRLTQSALAALQPGPGSANGLILHARPTTGRGLSILMPRPSGAASPASFDLARSNYLDLNFSQRVHWAALVGTFQLITTRPWVLWRLISSMLADAGGAARDALLERMLGESSVIQGLERQFQSLSTGAALTLSLDPTDLPEKSREGQEYRLRLESTVPGATVPEQRSRVYKPTIEAALRGLERLVNESSTGPDAQQGLKSFGQTLGEDVIQKLAGELEAERVRATGGQPECVAHLRLQIPGELMRYPWELMCDRRGFLCEQFAIGRQVFMGVESARAVPLRQPGPVKVLIVGDPKFTEEFIAYCQKARRFTPRQLPGAQLEAQMVANEFKRLRDELAGLPPVEVTSRIGEEITVADLRQCLRDGGYDIIHYAGHAFFDKDDPGGSAWLLSDGLLRAQEIRNTLAWSDTPPWLVFANACEAGMDAGAPRRYQGDVFGLATSFINQGVAAYIAPLWPVDDAVAAQLAIDFYRALLLERLTLGESLHRAKLLAKQDLANAESVRGGLSWASVVLYGDPTPRLLQSLWTPSAQRQKQPTALLQPAERATRPSKERIRGRRLAQASEDEARRLVSGPGMQATAWSAARGAEEALPTDQPVFELVEVNGIRFWQIIDPHNGRRRALPGSELAALACNDTVRGALGLQRGWKDYVKVVGRWIADKVTGGDNRPLLIRLAEQYDKDTVEQEQLLRIGADLDLAPLEPAPWNWLGGPLIAGQEDRVLLIIHGTFSKTAAPVDGLGKEFFQWAGTRYRGVIGLDHWTLSKTPEDNARRLWDLLDPRLRSGRRLDIITHSRGGLVARAFVELLGHAEAVRRVVFVGTPNAGTNLANPNNWGQTADMLINFVHADPMGVYGKLSGFLMNLFARDAIGDIPGLQAQNPTATGDQQFLGQLQKSGPPTGVLYSAVAANYEPGSGDFDLKSLSKTAFDVAADSFYGGPNDLVVDTSSVWAVDRAKDLKTAGAVIPAERLLLFNPDLSVASPAGAQLERMSGVHHTNLFTWKPTREFLRRQFG